MEQTEIKAPTAVGETIAMVMDELQMSSSGNAFIEANTTSSSLSVIKQEHIIPVFIKDNEPVISHSEFIEAAMSATADIYHGETILRPNIRLSHPVKGRVPEARNKPAKDLLDHEKTVYYERMAFIIEVPTIHTEIAGNRVNLTIGGVKAYNLDNLSTRSGADQHFKVFAGFQNKVCTNLCVSSDGYSANLKVKNVDMLQTAILSLLRNYDAIAFSGQLQELQNYKLTEQQFANLIGRCKMYKFLPHTSREDIPDLQFGDHQINAVCKDYYADNNFCHNPDGNINLWNLYNLFTAANKSTYIDSFLDRGLNAFYLTRELQTALQGNSDCWYLN